MESLVTKIHGQYFTTGKFYVCLKLKRCLNCLFCLKHISFSLTLKPILFVQYQYTKYTILNNRLEVHHQKILTFHFQLFFLELVGFIPRILGTFPKNFSQVTTSQGYFPKWQLAKCTISQAATCQVCPSCSDWPPLQPAAPQRA